MKMISLLKRCDKTDAMAAAKAGTKRGAKAATNTGGKAVAKATRSGCHLFLRDQLSNMTEEDQQNYRSILSWRWKKIKKDRARLFAYSNRACQIRDGAEKLIKSGYNLLVRWKNNVREFYGKKNTDSAPKNYQSLRSLSKQNQIIQTIMMKKKNLW